MLAIKTLASLSAPTRWEPCSSGPPSGEGLRKNERSREGCESRILMTSECDCSDTRTASADVTHPEQARQSVREICAGGGFSNGSLSSVVTS